MNLATIFSLSSLPVIPFWLLMIFLPHWRITKRIMPSPLVILAPALLYIILVVPRLSELLPIVNNPNLAAIATLLGTPAGATIAWVHFLAFDLFMGRWIYLDSREHQISAWLVGPILYLTLMLGPAGFAGYLGLRAVVAAMRRRSSRRAGYQAAQI